MATNPQPPSGGGGPQGGQPPAGGARPRAGAMTMAMQAVQIPGVQTTQKVLSIMHLHGSKVVEERTIRKRQTVYVGTSERNHFTIQAPGLAKEFPLFQLVGNDYILNFTEQMPGRIALPGREPEHLEKLRSTGAARNAGTHWQVKLNETSRGKISIGDSTLLFQFVAIPPVQPRPQLPAAVRGGLVKNIDWVFTAFVVSSFALHFGFVVYLENHDWPIPPGIADIQAEDARFLIPPEEEPEEQPQEQNDQPSEQPTETAQQETNQQRDRENNNSAQEQTSESDIASNAEARAALVEQAAAAAENLIVTALGEGGAFANVLAGGAITDNAEDVLASAAGVAVAQGGPGGIRTRSGGGTGSGVGGLGSLAAREGGTTAAQEGTEVVERVVRGRANFEPGEETGGSGTFDQDLVSRMVRTRLGAIRACYERELRRNPTLNGKITVEFTIQTTGATTGISTTENTMGSAEVASCIQGVVRGFRFNPGPTEGSVTYAYPFVFAPQS